MTCLLFAAVLPVSVASPATAVGEAPQLTVQPVDQIIGVGFSASFAATGTGDATPPEPDRTGLEMTWFMSDDNGATWAARGGCGVAGSGLETISCTTTFGPAEATDDGNLFRAELVNAFGTASTRAARLTVCSGTECVRPGLVVDPATDLVSGQQVEVSASNMPANTPFLISECLTGQPSSCNVFQTVSSDAAGNFALPYTVLRGAFGPDCRVDGCEIHAATNGALLGVAPITFVDVQPDLQLRRRSDGVISFDDVYEPFSPLIQRRIHTIEAGGKWTYAVLLQNDGAVVDNLRVRSPLALPSNFSARYFVGFYDVTAFVTGEDGLMFTNMQPGETRALAVQFRAAASATPGSSADVLLIATTPTDNSLFEQLRLTVHVPQA